MHGRVCRHQVQQVNVKEQKKGNMHEAAQLRVRRQYWQVPVPFSQANQYAYRRRGVCRE